MPVGGSVGDVVKLLTVSTNAEAFAPLAVPLTSWALMLAPVLANSKWAFAPVVLKVLPFLSCAETWYRESP